MAIAVPESSGRLPVTSTPTAYVPGAEAGASPTKVVGEVRSRASGLPTRSGPAILAVALAPSGQGCSLSTVTLRRPPETSARTPAPDAP